MGDLSDNFSRWEFACRCGKCKQIAVDYKLLEILERLRKKTGPITITSGNRCPAHNKAEGGAPKSKHLFSIAADFKVEDWSPHEIFMLLDSWYPKEYGLKEYNSWTHLDVRSKKWRG